MNSITISQWGGYLQSIADNGQKNLVSDKRGNIHVVDKTTSSKNFKRLNIDQIINITLEVFENSTKITNDDRLHIINGLESLKVRRSEKYERLHSVRKFFAGKSTQKRVEEDITKINYIESLIHVDQNYSNRLLKDFEQEIPPGLAPEVIELTIATLLKDQMITDVLANHASIHTMCEKAAQKYLEKNEVHNAFRVRMLVNKTIGPSSFFKYFNG